MANIIIPPEHQSAPKVRREYVNEYLQLPPEPEPQKNFAAPDGAGLHSRGYGPSRAPGDFDTEMDLPEGFATPQDRAEYEELQRIGYGRTTAAVIEEAERQFAINQAAMKPYQWQGQERWQGRDNEEMRLVRILHPHTVIERLRRAGVNCTTGDPLEWYRDNTECLNCGRLQRFHVGRELRCDELGNGFWNPDAGRWPKPAARLWLNSFARLGRVGVTAWVEGEPKTVTTLQYPYGPEWTIMRFDRYNVPTNERYRGWRTAMLGLITEGVLTEREVERAFGPAEGPAASFYNRQLYLHRRIFMGLARRGEGAA